MNHHWSVAIAVFMIRYQIVSWQCTLQNCKFLSEHHHISWKKLFQETTVLSYKFVRDTTSLGFQNKRNCSLWGYSNKNHSVVVFLTRKSLLWQGSLVAFNEHLKTVNDNSCFLAKGILETLGHGLPKLMPVWPVNKGKQSLVHYQNQMEKYS